MPGLWQALNINWCYDTEPFSLEPLVWDFSCVTFKRSPVLPETGLPQLFKSRNSPRDVRVGATGRRTAVGSGCVQAKPLVMRPSWWQGA